MKTEKKKGMKTMAAFILAMTMLAPLAGVRLARVFRFVGRKGKFAGERLLVRFFGFLLPRI